MDFSTRPLQKFRDTFEEGRQSPLPKDESLHERTEDRRNRWKVIIYGFGRMIHGEWILFEVLGKGKE
jgi:hypothetical protein